MANYGNIKLHRKAKQPLETMAQSHTKTLAKLLEQEKTFRGLPLAFAQLISSYG